MTHLFCHGFSHRHLVPCDSIQHHYATMSWRLQSLAALFQLCQGQRGR